MDFLESFFNKVSPLLDWMWQIKVGGEEGISKLAGFKEYIDYKNRLDTARKAQNSPNPSIEEINDAIVACDKLLGASASAESAAIEQLRNVRLPDLSSVLEPILKNLDVKLDEKTLTSLKKFYDSSPKMLTLNSVSFSMTLVVLAIMNTYLVPHAADSRYSLTFSEEHSLVRKFVEIDTLLRNCLELARR